MSNTLNQLLRLGGENEIIEFKEAKNTYDFNKLGRYFSALSNEANLQNLKRAWLVFGVKENQTVIGSQFHRSPKDDFKRKFKSISCTNFK